ncbi:MAG: 4Fe-4S dicluster domain-containing protein, partial [Candidatus Binatia bacterium]
YEPAYFFDRARVILSLDADFLLHDRDAIRHARDFMNGRRVEKSETMSRLYVAESALSITGIAADHRLSLQSGRIAALAAALAAELGVGSAPAETADSDRKWVQAVAADLKANRGQSLIVAGALQPPAVHAAVTALNAALGNVGKTVAYYETKETARSRTEDLKSLVAAMQGGEVKTLAILGGNPVYDAPADLEFGKALEKVENTVRLGLYVDETSAAAKWHLPQAHFLESWGDARAVGGPLSVTQPLIEPLFGGRNMIEILWLLAEGAEKSGYEIVRETWKTILPPADFERSWSRVLHDGLLEGSELAPATPRLAARAALAEDPLVSAPAAKADDLEIVFRPSSVVHDGQFANNAWLQELPEPVTKLTWDNAAWLSVATARELQVGDGDVVRVKYKERELTAPVLIVPGQADHSVSLPLGYGRTAAGRVGTGVGFNAYALRTADAVGFDRGARLERAGGRHVLATTHEHWSTEGRDLVREVSLQRFREDPHVVHDHPKHQPWTPIALESRPQWGMSVDLGSCIGCNACVVACQSENNVPVVGKDQVTRGREMHWLRVDRYYSGGPQAPETIVFQPVPCMQCENAPCEQVCPVAATLHDEQGLNVMVYNRCIGTRYCSNNCPYKVRRFNFYNFTRDTPELLKLANNPDVTVRARGVMEKCSYCVQRLTRAKIDAKLEERELKDGDVQTACQQACPTRAIEFGDIGDGESAVAKLKASGRSYELLPELNTRPRTTYLVRVRNPNPELGEA